MFKCAKTLFSKDLIEFWAVSKRFKLEMQFLNQDIKRGYLFDNRHQAAIGSKERFLWDIWDINIMCCMELVALRGALHPPQQ